VRARASVQVITPRIAPPSPRSVSPPLKRAPTMASFLNRLRRRRTISAEQPPTAPTPTTTPTPSSEPSTPASQPAVAIEEPSQNEPPPYTASTTAIQTTTPATQQPDTDTARGVVSHEITQGLLDPNLNFTAAQMEYQWRQKDIIFARAVVQFIAERFDGNLKGWAGYKYTYICEVPPLPRISSLSLDYLAP